ncbi:hypothetical protein C8T65DRAFT_641342 [Cerioporus squamosus]|nr:hypothetical protein C8T65DRAFT_641342 [Cerioporus squamosus]
MQLVHGARSHLRNAIRLRSKFYFDASSTELSWQAAVRASAPFSDAARSRRTVMSVPGTPERNAVRHSPE